MNKPGFTFECKSLNLDEIERIICEHYDLGIAKSLGSPPFMMSEGNTPLKFSAENGIISCRLHRCKNPVTELYTVEVGDVEVEFVEFYDVFQE